jgi:hypothetical protein
MRKRTRSLRQSSAYTVIGETLPAGFRRSRGHHLVPRAESKTLQPRESSPASRRGGRKIWVVCPRLRYKRSPSS